jgi:hypothetical protein
MWRSPTAARSQSAAADDRQAGAGGFALRFRWFCIGTDSRRHQTYQTRQVGLKPYVQLIYLHSVPD